MPEVQMTPRHGEREAAEENSLVPFSSFLRSTVPGFDHTAKGGDTYGGFHVQQLRRHEGGKMQAAEMSRLRR